MKVELVEILKCPECGNTDLGLSVFAEDGLEVMEGLITCGGCGRQYAVIGGVPRVLPDALAGAVFEYHPDFFERHKIAPPAAFATADPDTVRLKKKTHRSFSFQWNTFREIYKQFRLENYSPDGMPEGHLKGKRGLDAGCGFGRYTMRVEEMGADVVGLDLSEAVEAAFENVGRRKGVNIVQGDIYNPPFRKGAFDFVYSLGVLHHLPDPEGGFESLCGLLDPSQEIFVWCYDNEKPLKNRGYELIRKLTTHMNFRALYYFCLVMAVGIRVLLNWPALAASGITGRPVRDYPYGFYADHPLRVLHADLFDVFSVPSTRYYDQDEVNAWFTRRGIAIISSVHRVSGWTVWGTR